VSLEPNVTAIIAVAAAAVVLVLVIVVLLLALRLSRLTRTYRAAIGPDAPDDLVAAVAEQQRTLASLRDDISTVHSNTETLRDHQRGALSRIGLVRYDAFPDMGGMLSFSAALLDERGDGVVISAINGRQETRAYGKPMVAGESDHSLSDEERDAVRAALDGGRAAPLAAPGGKRRRRA
jgi:hypothetical protein